MNLYCLSWPKCFKKDGYCPYEHPKTEEEIEKHRQYKLQIDKGSGQKASNSNLRSLLHYGEDKKGFMDVIKDHANAGHK